MKYLIKFERFNENSEPNTGSNKQSNTDDKEERKPLELKVGDIVKYKMNGYDDKENPDSQTDKIGSRKILRIEGDNIYFMDKQGKEFYKTKEDIISDMGKKKTELKKDVQPVNKKIKENPFKVLMKKISSLRNNPNKMKEISNFVDFEKKNNK
jgi:hypothetical protein